MATSTFKVSRGNYAKIKKSIGKDSDTLYFGYDNNDLCGIFLGDIELTSTIRNVTCSLNTHDSKYLDLCVTKIGERGQLLKFIYKIANNSAILDSVNELSILVNNLKKDINDVSVRLALLSINVDKLFNTVNLLILDSSNYVHTTINNRLNILDTSVNNLMDHGVDYPITANVTWIDLD